MPSDLQVSNIKDLTGSNTGLSIASDGQVTITQNNPTIQLGSNAQFPAGHIVGIQHANPTDTSSTDYEFSTTTSVQLGAVELGDDYSTSVLSSASNKLFVTVSFSYRVNSSTAGDHWRLGLQGDGIPNLSFANFGYPIIHNFHYGITTYFEINGSANYLATPGKTNPEYKINCVNAGGSSTLHVMHISWTFMEVQV